MKISGPKSFLRADHKSGALWEYRRLVRRGTSMHLVVQRIRELKIPFLLRSQKREIILIDTTEPVRKIHAERIKHMIVYSGSIQDDYEN